MAGSVAAAGDVLRAPPDQDAARGAAAGRRLGFAHMRVRIIAEERCSHPGGRAHASAAIWILALGLFSGAVASEPGAGSVPEPAPIGADSLLGRRVERVRVVTRTIYDPLPAGRFRALYRLANKLHIPTRAGTIRQELLLGPGEPWDPARADESARKLRALQFIDTVSVRARPESSGVAVDVMTRDAWSSGVDFGFQGGGGQRVGSAGFTERNLLGLGKALSVTYQDDGREISRSVWVEDPNVLGRRWRASVSGARTTSGTVSAVWLGLPFYAEDAPQSFGVSWNRATGKAVRYQSGEQIADFDQRIEDALLWWTRGQRLGQTIVRFGGRLELLDRRFGVSHLTSGSPRDFGGNEESLRLRLLAADLKLWRPRYVQRWQVEHLERTEDIDLGTSLDVGLGAFPRFLGSTADQAYGALGLAVGGELSGSSFWWLRASASGRARHAIEEAHSRVETRLVTQGLPRQTLVLGALGDAAYGPARNQQFVVGGLNGLRGFDAQQIAGQQIWRLNLEDRVFLKRGLGQLVSLGSVAFVDAARSWGPGADGVGWLSDAGVGLRVALARQAVPRVARFDFAWPLNGALNSSPGVALSFGSAQAF